MVYLDWATFQKKDKKDKKDTIEHILPQTPDKSYWKKRWKNKEIREAIHDIGNLVITLDNSSYGKQGF
jgi:gentisate 1,2-dioxygenase